MDKNFQMERWRFDHDGIADFETHEKDETKEIISKAKSNENLLEDEE